MSQPRQAKPEKPRKRYRGANIPRAVIRRFAREVAERFKPDKIILFGSYAYGTPHEDSDVDILVVMPARDEISLAVRIRMAVWAPFPMDLIVRTPKRLARRIALGDSFVREITSQGKTLYEKADGGVGGKSGGRSPHRKKAGPKRPSSA